MGHLHDDFAFTLLVTLYTIRKVK